MLKIQLEVCGGVKVYYLFLQSPLCFSVDTPVPGFYIVFENFTKLSTLYSDTIDARSTKYVEPLHRRQTAGTSLNGLIKSGVGVLLALWTVYVYSIYTNCALFLVLSLVLRWSTPYSASCFSKHLSFLSLAAGQGAPG